MKFDDLLNEYNVPTRSEGHEHCRPGWIQIDCPFCSPGWGHFRMGYNIPGNYVNCWTCGRHSLYDTILELTGVTKGVAARLLRGLEVERNYTVEKKERGTLVIPKGVGPMKNAHRKYLKGRGFVPEDIERIWDVKGISISSTLSWRLFIPVIYRGDVVSWTTRSIDDKHSQRYISASPEQEAIDHKTLLYGEDYCRYTVIICEGPTDVWRVGPGAVCTFGTAFSQAQLIRLSKYNKRVVCYDNSPDAQARATKLVNLLEPFSGMTYNVVLDADDPGSASDEEVEELRNRFL